MPSNSARHPVRQPFQSRSVAFVLFPQTKLLDVAGPLQVFSDARFENGYAAYNIFLASEAGGNVRTDAGLPIPTVTLGELPAVIDTVIVSGGSAARGASQSRPLREWLFDRSQNSRRIASVCLGAFVLAEAGLLDGCAATTHWEAREVFLAKYPKICLLPDLIFVNSGRLWTSAGVSAGIDMALAMVEEDLGHDRALELARNLVLYLKRPGGQSQFSSELKRQLSDAEGRFDRLHSWISNNTSEDLSIEKLAAFVSMSPRNFARVYRRTMGESPGRVVEAIRLSFARRLLESSSRPIKLVAELSGFGDDERLRRAFVRRYGISPSDHRKRFGSADRR